MEGFASELQGRLADVYRGGRWICVATFAAVANRFAAEVATVAGSDIPTSAADRQEAPILGLAVHETDPDPDDGFRILSLDRPSSGDFVTDALGTAAELADLPASMMDEFDGWDPDRTARVLVPPIVAGQEMAGRTVFGGRPPEWAALEDKLAVLEILDAAGIPTAPALVVDLDDREAVMSAHTRLAGANGTVWAVDNSNGMHGGAAGTHWVPSTARAAELAERLTIDHDRIRVMPFLDGVPCSIHGIVLDETTVTSRPSEMMVYVDEVNQRFKYCRFGNHWDPPAAARVAMAAAAAAVGEALKAAVGFRGVFSLDGILTADGFRPTEVNPRYGMALPMTLPVPDGGVIHTILLDKAIIAGEVRPDPERLQRWLVTALDDERRGGASFGALNKPAASRTARIVADGEEPRLLDDSEAGAGASVLPDDELESSVLATATWTRLGAGQRLNLTFGAAWPIGPPSAPLAWRIAALVDAAWNVGLDPHTPALSLRYRQVSG